MEGDKYHILRKEETWTASLPKLILHIDTQILPSFLDVSNVQTTNFVVPEAGHLSLPLKKKFFFFFLHFTFAFTFFFFLHFTFATVYFTQNILFPSVFQRRVSQISLSPHFYLWDKTKMHLNTRYLLAVFPSSVFKCFSIHFHECAPAFLKDGQL